AFSLDALERDPDAEIAVLGSPFPHQLHEAIRARAARLSLGLIAPAAASDPSSPPVPLSLRESGDHRGVDLTIPVRDGVAKAQKTHVAVHPVGRLVARVVLRAGAGVEEAVVESDVYDLSAGARLDDDLAGLFLDLEAGRAEPADPSLAAAAQRPLSGAAAWIMACPHCGRPPAALVICRHDHCSCEACSYRCSVCAEDFCADHGIAECRVDSQPACAEHVHVCPSCRLQHCTAHEGICTEGGDGGDGHTACSTCLAPCGSCGRLSCK